MVKNPPASVGDSRDPVSVPGGLKESDTTERLSTAQHISSICMVLVGNDWQFLSFFIFCHSDSFVVVLWGFFYF